MAYKDEYEVARLYSNGDFKRYLQQTFEGSVSLNFHLAPPVFSPRDPVTGAPRKMRFPELTAYLFRLLAPFKCLRGTRLDPFGMTQERIKERQTLKNYRALFLKLASELDKYNIQTAVQIAELPMQIRGYGHIKADNLIKTEARKATLLRQFRGELVPLATAIDVAA